MLVVGRNGAGKTNLLEALHVGIQGFSPRTRAEPRLVRFGEQAARVRLEGVEGGASVETEVTIAPGEGKRMLLNGAALASAEELRARLGGLAFVPDRLAIVKGGPAVRRAYVDRMLGRFAPSLAGLPADYGRTLAQRNEALRRVRAGASTREAVEPWTKRLALLGTELDAARAALLSALDPGFGGERGRARPRAGDARLRGARAVRWPTSSRGSTETWPAGRRAWARTCAMSRSERPTATCAASARRASSAPPSSALLLAEAALLAERRGSPPLLLLDDVFSELDVGTAAGASGRASARRADAGHRNLGRRPSRRRAAAPALILTVRRKGNESVVEAA